MIAPSKPNCISHKSMVDSSPQVSQSTTGGCSVIDCCDISNGRPRFISDHADGTPFGVGYKWERMATSIEDSAPS